MKVITDFSVSSRPLRVGAGFDPRCLFARGANGTYWSAAYPARVFADTAAGTSAQFGQSVARVNDVSPNELNPVQPNTAQRPLLGIAPLGGRRNLLLRTEDLTSNYWDKRNDLTVTHEGDGVFRLTDAIRATPTRYAIRANSGSGVMSSGPRTVSVDVKAGTISHIILAQQTSGTQNAQGGSSTIFDIANGQFSFVGGGFVATSVQNLADGWFRISASRNDAESASFRGFSIGMGDNDYVGDGSGTVFVRFPQAEAGLEPNPYQRVGATGLDVTEQGLPSPAFIRFDLSDDVLTTTFPDGGTFDVMLFGRKGSWIERDMTITPGDSLNIGPTTITGGPEGLLDIMGDLVGWLVLDRMLTDPEISRLARFHKRLGAGELLEAN
jgi:hypothetical protein